MDKNTENRKVEQQPGQGDQAANGVDRTENRALPFEASTLPPFLHYLLFMRWLLWDICCEQSRKWLYKKQKKVV